MSWTETIIKGFAKDQLFIYLAPHWSLDSIQTILIPILNQFKNSSKQSKTAQFSAVLDTLKLYEADKQGYFREHYPRFDETMNMGELQKKMDILLEEFGTKWVSSAAVELQTLAAALEEETTTEKIDEFLKLAAKHPKIVKDNDNFRELKIRFEKMAKGSMLSFTAGNPPKSLLTKFNKIIEGELHWLGVKAGAWAIHYPDLTVGEWMKNWNALFYKKGEFDFRGAGSSQEGTSIRNYAKEFKRLAGGYGDVRVKKILSPILVELKQYTPTIQGAGVSKVIPIPNPISYEVVDFTSQDLRNYIEEINKVQGINTAMFLPTGDMKIDVGGETQVQSVSNLKELMFSTKTGGTLRSSPYLGLILSETGGNEWFEQLLKKTKTRKILSDKQMEILLVEDAMKAFRDPSISNEKGTRITPLFGIEIPEDAPDEEEKFKTWFKNEQVDIGDVQRGEGEGMLATISPKHVKSLDAAIEKIGLKALLVRPNLHEKKSIGFRKKQVGSLIRIEVVDGDDAFNAAELKALIELVREKLKIMADEAFPEDPDKAPNLVSRASDLGELHKLTTDMAVSDLLQTKKFTQLMLGYPLLETSKVELGGSTLSQLSPQNLIAFFAKLDSLLGYGEGAGSVLDYYGKIDKSNIKNEKIALANELEKALQKRIEGYRSGIVYAFETRLKTIIKTKGVGEGKGQLPQKLLDRLAERNLVTVVEV